MALHRSSVSGRTDSSKNVQQKEDDSENNGYIQVLVKPLEQGNINLLLNWLGISRNRLSKQQLVGTYSIITLVAGLVLYEVLRCDIGSLFQRLCGLLVPMFTIVCLFNFLSLYLRKTWNTTSTYLLFISCIVGETVAQIFFNSWGHGSNPDPGDKEALTVTHSAVVFIVLLSVCVASIFSSLESAHSAAVIILVTFTRFLSCSTLWDLPQFLRPYVAYACGILGVIISKCIETILKPPINNFMTHDGKISVIKRRRSSSSGVHAFSAHRSTRRTSLPALIPKSQCSSTSFESAILGEAHGLITDMLNDTSLPLHVVSGLRTLSNLLKPPDNHSSFHKPRVSPLVSLTESNTYGSDSEENPYTGERPNMLPKKMRRSLPPSLIRRMSTSTWTTTTSATGMPTLELEPCRVRSSSFRHSRDGTPASSPVGSRSNSPSPSSPTVVLTIPKSRSFSLATPSPSGGSHSKRLSRKSMAPSTQGVDSGGMSASTKHISPLAKEDIDGNTPGEEGAKSSPNIFSVNRRLNLTSDYESNDSPSSSDHSDSVLTSEDLRSNSPPKRGVYSRGSLGTSHISSRIQRVIHDSRIPDDIGAENAEDADEEDVDDHEEEQKKEIIRLKTPKHDINVTNDLEVSAESSSHEFPWDPNEIDHCDLLQMHKLSQWDYPIFDLANNYPKSILSRLVYKLFMDVGLFESFRIPLTPFLNYFHILELGYREKPYHNRVHAADVLHGVYYLTTQPIPGFTQQCPTSDVFSRNGSSSESDCESLERTHTRVNSFVAEDTYGIMGGNFPALELMALYTAAAMHDYDHPGRTNAFLVATYAPQAVLYNDRSVLENHHAASAWSLIISNKQNNFLTGLDAAEFKRFRFLVIESILATDLKRHWEILAEFNAKANEEESSPGIDWTVETDRLLVMEMVIKLADINGPTKTHCLHRQWTDRISEEFYEQGDEEQSLGMPISPYMDRKNPQLAKLQETFINHLVAPLCNAMVMAGLLPGTWVEETDSDMEALSDLDRTDDTPKDTEDENECDQAPGSPIMVNNRNRQRKINCLLTKNMKENYEIWVECIKEEEAVKNAAKDLEASTESLQSKESEMEPIKEETESPGSTNSSPESSGTPTKTSPGEPLVEDEVQQQQQQREEKEEQEEGSMTSTVHS